MQALRSLRLITFLRRLCGSCAERICIQPSDGTITSLKKLCRACAISVGQDVVVGLMDCLQQLRYSPCSRFEAFHLIFAARLEFTLPLIPPPVTITGRASTAKHRTGAFRQSQRCRLLPMRSQPISFLPTSSLRPSPPRVSVSIVRLLPSNSRQIPS
jgi:hypothetical protein